MRMFIKSLIAKMTADKTLDKVTGQREKEVLRILEDYKLDHNGNSPSFQEIVDLAIDIDSKSTLAKTLNNLEEIGLIVQPGGSKSLVLVGGKFTVDNVKCLWKDTGTEGVQQTGCEKYFFGGHSGYVYCPYCSKPIEG